MAARLIGPLRAQGGDTRPGMVQIRRSAAARPVARLVIAALARGLALALVASFVCAPALAQGRSLSTLRSSLDQWHRAPSGWDGLTPRTGERFLEAMNQAVTVASAADPAPGDPDREEVWALLLRAAALQRPGVTSQPLLDIASEARGHLLRLAATPEAGLQGWAMFEVIGHDSTESDQRGGGVQAGGRPTTAERAVALDVLVAARVRSMRAALLMVARRDHDPLRPDVLRELARWAKRFGPDEAVDLFLVQLLGTSAARRQVPHPVNIVLERVDSDSIPLGARAQVALRARIVTMLISPDWRKAAQAMRLSKGLSVETRVPMLLDALNVWDKRANSKRAYVGLIRTRGDLVRTLRELSGRKHGPEPGPWIDWWIAVQQGKLPMPGTEEFRRAQRERAQQPMSTASFFGLRPETDRVTFILDFSGSMEATWATSGHSRYVEAVEQMMRFLQASPPTTRFNVILFNGSPLRSSEELVAATPDNLERARRSLLNRTPEGGTHLRPAVELALGLDRSGLPDLEKVEADTIVVLCDGETAGGRRWVEPTLRRVLPHYPVVFHAVHLGPHDDGALRDLAELSGGEFLRVGR